MKRELPAMSQAIALSLRHRDELVEIEVRVRHPMQAGETYSAKTGKIVAPNFLQTIAIQLNAKTLLEGQLGPALANNPVFRFSVRSAKTGDKIVVSCSDNQGQRFEQEIVVPAFGTQ